MCLFYFFFLCLLLRLHVYANLTILWFLLASLKIKSLTLTLFWLQPEQLNKIYELCGTPDEVNWPGVSKIPWYGKFKPARPMKRRVREVFRQLSVLSLKCWVVWTTCFCNLANILSSYSLCSFDRHALDLLDKMLTLDPSQVFSLMWL